MSTSEHQGLPVKGYLPQSEATVAAVNANKELEERVLRRLDEIAASDLKADGRWYSIARTQIEQGFMALNRAIFRPGRASLPEDQA